MIVTAPHPDVSAVSVENYSDTDDILLRRVYNAPNEIVRGEAFSELHARIAPELEQYSLMLTQRYFCVRDSQLAYDIAQETWLQVLPRIVGNGEPLLEYAHLRNYIFVNAHNKVRDHGRRLRRNRENGYLGTVTDVFGNSPKNRVEHTDFQYANIRENGCLSMEDLVAQHPHLESRLELLPREQKVVLKMHLKGFNLTTISRELNLGEPEIAREYDLAIKNLHQIGKASTQLRRPMVLTAEELRRELTSQRKEVQDICCLRMIDKLPYRDISTLTGISTPELEQIVFNTIQVLNASLGTKADPFNSRSLVILERSNSIPNSETNNLAEIRKQRVRYISRSDFLNGIASLRPENYNLLLQRYVHQANNSTMRRLSGMKTNNELGALTIKAHTELIATGSIPSFTPYRTVVVPHTEPESPDLPKNNNSQHLLTRNQIIALAQEEFSLLIAPLSITQRKILSLRYIDNQTTSEIALTLSMSEERISKFLYSAQAYFRAFFGDTFSFKGRLGGSLWVAPGPNSASALLAKELSVQTGPKGKISDEVSVGQRTSLVIWTESKFETAIQSLSTDQQTILRGRHKAGKSDQVLAQELGVVARTIVELAHKATLHLRDMGYKDMHPKRLRVIPDEGATAFTRELNDPDWQRIEFDSLLNVLAPRRASALRMRYLEKLPPEVCMERLEITSSVKLNELCNKGIKDLRELTEKDYSATAMKRLADIVRTDEDLSDTHFVKLTMQEFMFHLEDISAPLQRQALLLCYAEGLSTGEISKRMGKPARSVTEYIRGGITSLQSHLHLEKLTKEKLHIIKP